ncbi:hypothetical protein VNO78_11728 [Psophocarpus tetragonolobus]|uniref:Uncharacterized protein n=1 Tax=Psophocarpus tetragonolobus TaxID=3891 RepID=A0AAN9SUD1_PSOTE
MLRTHRFMYVGTQGGGGRGVCSNFYNGPKSRDLGSIDADVLSLDLGQLLMDSLVLTVDEQVGPCMKEAWASCCSSRKVVLTLRMGETAIWHVNEASSRLSQPRHSVIVDGRKLTEGHVSLHAGNVICCRKSHDCYMPSLGVVVGVGVDNYSDMVGNYDAWWMGCWGSQSSKEEAVIEAHVEGDKGHHEVGVKGRQDALIR